MPARRWIDHPEILINLPRPLFFAELGSKMSALEAKTDQ
jgi:hypothetical protein